MNDLKRYDNLIKKILIQKNNKVCFQRRDKILKNLNRYPNINYFLKHRIPEAESFNEFLWMFKEGIETRKRCPVCGKAIKMDNGRACSIQVFCSQKCQRKNNALEAARIHRDKLQNDSEYRQQYKEKHAKTIQNKYGMTASEFMKSKREQIVSKGKETIKEKYGVDSWSEFVKLDWVQDKMDETFKNHYGVSKKETHKVKEIADKKRKTNLKTIKERYNVDSFTELYLRPEIQEKKLNTLKKHGWNSQSEMASDKRTKKKRDDTIREKYGYENLGELMKSEEIQTKKMETIKQRGWNSWKDMRNDPEIIEKTNNTIKEKYGVKNLSDLMKSNYIQQKSYKTKKKNKTFAVSKPENDIYVKLKEIYTNIKRQYRDNLRYPFFCDFYIPELDLFIEYQGFRTHGPHPFDDKNEEDIQILEELKYKNKDLKERTGRTETLYDRIIDGWTITDPFKRETAKKNNLNYIEIWPDWSFDKILKTIDSYKKKED